MDHPLPPPIAAYVEANARLDREGMLTPFAEDAMVLDDGGRHEGREALKAWIQSTTLDNEAVFTPETWREENGRVLVGGLTAGAFKGSPIHFTFAFTLDGAAIAALEIH